LLPGLLTFLKRWWWLLLLGGLLSLFLFAWLAIALLLWAWDTLPHLLSYLVNHFAPVWQNLPATPPPGTEDISL
jgi:hypothetical protein